MDYYNIEVEVWKEIPEFEAYEVSNLGGVRTRIQQHREKTVIVSRDNEYRRILKQSVRSKGHLQVFLWKLGPDGKLKPRSIRSKTQARPVHQLVLETFVGPRPIGMVCRHWDGNPKNNRLDNLSYGTRSDNEQDKKRHGTYQFGENNPVAKLTAQDVRAIDALSRDGTSNSEIAGKFNILERHVRRILRRDRWSHIPV